MAKYLNLSIVLQKLNVYRMNMLKKIIVIVLLAFPLANCASLNQINERAKGDGIPYIPGI